MAEKASSALRTFDAALRITSAIAGTLPMTALLLSLVVRGLFGGSALAETLALVLLLPCWLLVSSLCLVAESGVRVAGFIAGVTAVAACLLRMIG